MSKGPGKITGYALKHLTKKPATTSYPFTPIKVEPNYRGKLEFDPEKCIGCNLCVRDCPAYAIKITNIGTKEEKKFQLTYDMDHCIFCAQCVDSCRKGALSMTQNVELAAFDRKSLKEDI